jgi:hypothetical protein
MQIIKLIHRRIVARALRKRKNEGHEIDVTEMAVDSDDNEDYDEKSLEESFLITNKAVNIFGYLNLLINLNLPFSAIENPSLQAAIKYDKIKYEEEDSEEESGNIEEVKQKLTHYANAAIESNRKTTKKNFYDYGTIDVYQNLAWIPPTTNELERLFSRCKHVLTDCRSRMTPLHFEAVMLLKYNQQLWTCAHVERAIKLSLNGGINNGLDEFYEEEDIDI